MLESPLQRLSRPRRAGCDRDRPPPRIDWFMNHNPLRIDKLQHSLKSDGLDGLLVSSATNVSYLTGFTGDSSALLVSRERVLIISDGRFSTQIEQECPGLEATIRHSAQSLNQAIAQVVASLAPGRLGFEAAILSVADFQATQQDRDRCGSSCQRPIASSCCVRSRTIAKSRRSVRQLLLPKTHFRCSVPHCVKAPAKRKSPT